MKLAVTVLAVAVLLAASALSGCGKRIPFDQKRWLHADDLTSVRTEMVQSLLHDHPLKGMDRKAVIALLGPPTPTDKWRGYDLIYVLGPDGIDFHWLLIKLDDRGQVASAEVRSD